MLEMIQLSSLENILPKFSQTFTPVSKLQVFAGEYASWQIACRMDRTDEYRITLESDIREHLQLFRVVCVPVMRAIFNTCTMDDPQYLGKEAGMYPDLLEPMEGETFRGSYHYQGFWIAADDTVPAGTHRATVTIRRDEEVAQATMTLEVLPQALPPQKLKYSISVHGDCLADYYGVEVFSEAHWQLLEDFIRCSARLGSNMLVPPVITPPVDTAVGGQRRTVQLVRIHKEGDRYTFDFSLFRRYIAMCLDAGITDFFMPQFFTQWGAAYCPKIEIWENGQCRSCFGWETESTDPKYLAFLQQFLPALLAQLRQLGLEKHTMFSISDEPFGDEAVARYATLSAFLKPLLEDFPTIDAFTNFEHYRTSGAQLPLIPTDKVEGFVGKVPQLHVYYCCVQDYKVSNRLICMPSYRNRCFGYQLYRYQVTGFFHWALNFYNAQLSVHPIDPYLVTDAEGGFPAGDAFSVYPGPCGPLPSLRSLVFREALQDLRALQLLEDRIGRESTLRLLEECVGEVTFDRCAQDAATILRLRQKIAETYLQLTAEQKA